MLQQRSARQACPPRQIDSYNNHRCLRQIQISTTQIDFYSKVTSTTVVAKTHKMPCFYMSFSAKEPYN